MHKIIRTAIILIIIALVAFSSFHLYTNLMSYVKVNHILDKITDEPLSIQDSVENIEESITVENGYREKKVLYPSYNKTFENYLSITDTTSKQWDMIYNQKLFNITVDGYLMTEDKYYAVALGSYFGGLGSKYLMILDTGKVIPVCKLDEKKDEHTDSTYHFMATQSSDVIEFIIDKSKMGKVTYSNGFPYGGNFNNCEDFNGTIVKIIVVEEK